MHLCDGNCRSKFVLNGADLMLPGVLVPRHRLIFMPLTSFDPLTVAFIASVCNFLHLFALDLTMTRR